MDLDQEYLTAIAQSKVNGKLTVLCPAGFNNDIVRRKIRTVNAHFCVVIFHGRYATILYFLDNVEDGGETAFPIADNSTFDDEVSAVIKELYIEYHILPSALSSELIRHLVK